MVTDKLPALILKKGGEGAAGHFHCRNRQLESGRCRRRPLQENAAEELGRAAAEKIAACVKHGVKMDTQEFDPRLVIRNSVRMKTGEERKEEHAGTIKERSL